METKREEERRRRRRKKSPLSILMGLLILVFVAFVGLTILINLVSGAGGSILPTFGDSIAILDINGIIFDTEKDIELLQQYRDNPRIRAIVVRIDSPGGTVGAAQEIYSEIRKVRGEGKVVFASMANTAASGGYYIACATDQIYANPGTVTGSIGVILESMNYEELIQKIGLEFRVVKSGEHKDILSPTRPMTDDEERILKGLINNVYEQFVEAIFEGRSAPLSRSLHLIRNSSGTFEDFLSSATATKSIAEAKSKPRGKISDDETRAYIRSIADGRIYSGEQAYRLGLVDHLGTLDDAVDAAAKRVGIEGEPHVVRYRAKPGIFDLVGGKFGAWVRSVPSPTDVTLQYRLIIR